MILGNPVRVWMIASGAFALSFLALLVARRVALRRLRIVSAGTATLLDDALFEIGSVTRTYFIFAVAAWVSAQSLALSPELRELVRKAFVVTCFFQASAWGGRAVAFWIEKYLRQRSLADAAAATSLGLISFAVRFALYAVLALLTIHNLGFDVTTLIAGLGVGGVAIALAVQNILGDLFASLTIVLDKPFVVGDFIVVGEFMGSIEHIGLKTTRLRSLSGEQLVFANGDLLQSRLRNYQRMSERRVPFTLGVTYQTRPEQLARIPAIIREVVAATPKTRFDRCHFLSYGDSSLNFETVYWVLSPDFNEYADIAQAINLGIFGRFAAEGIEFAHPVRTLFVRGPRAT
jgi:small-conductance mechanosensitive channel